jgi:hypothetical protein
MLKIGARDATGTRTHPAILGKTSRSPMFLTILAMPR